MSRLNPVDPAFTRSTNSGSQKSDAFAHKTDAIRIVAIGADAYVSIGSEPDAGPTNFLVTVGEPEILSLGAPKNQRVVGITTGATTVVSLPEGTGCPFNVGDTVSLTVTGQSYYDFTHQSVTAVNTGNRVDGYTPKVTINTSTAGIVTALSANSQASLRNSLKIAAEARTSTGSIHCQQVQNAGQQKTMKLIREEIESVKFLVETTKSGKKSLYIEGVFLQGNIKNRNGRMYPMETLRKEVSRYNESNVQSGRALGELGHPDGPTVNLDRVSHKIVSLRESGSNFIGKAKILNTPMGKIASALVEDGVKLGVSSRGIGSLKTTREGVNIVGDDFMLATAADIVADPSAPDAFVEGIMEGKEWVWDGGLLREKYAEQTKNKINALVEQKALEEHKLQLWSDFIANL